MPPAPQPLAHHMYAQSIEVDFRLMIFFSFSALADFNFDDDYGLMRIRHIYIIILSIFKVYFEFFMSMYYIF